MDSYKTTLFEDYERSLKAWHDRLRCGNNVNKVSILPEEIQTELTKLSQRVKLVAFCTALNLRTNPCSMYNESLRDIYLNFKSEHLGALSQTPRSPRGSRVWERHSYPTTTNVGRSRGCQAAPNILPICV